MKAIISNLNGVKNQFVINHENGDVFFQSHESMIAKKSNGKIYLDPDFYNYSKTTSRHLAKFLGIDSATLKKGIKNGEYIFEKLN